MRARQMTERFLWTIALGAATLLPVAAVAQTPSPPPSGSNVMLPEIAPRTSKSAPEGA
jgi:hypothetical protein